MTKNYQSLQATYYPANPTICDGDPSIYTDLIWTEVAVSQVDLDTKWLEYLKSVRYNEIDTKTGQLISQGFTFDARTFSMSITAQINWSNFPNLPVELFPLSIMDTTENIYVLSLLNKTNFYLAALNYKNTQLQSGSALKGQIKACIDEACINAIIDNR